MLLQTNSDEMKGILDCLLELWLKRVPKPKPKPAKENAE